MAEPAKLPEYTVGQEIEIQRMGGVSFHRAIVQSIDDRKQPIIVKVPPSELEVKVKDLALYRHIVIRGQFSSVLH